MPIHKTKHFYHHPTLLVALLLIVLAGVLFFGLRPKDYDFSNNFSTIEGNRGLRFEKYSIAYTQPFAADMVRQLENLEEFTLFLNLKTQPDFSDGFGLILVMHDGNDADQLIIGQWKSHIIAMNGDDYAHKRRLPRISFDISEKSRIDKPEIEESRIVKSEIVKSGIEKSGFGIQVVLASGDNGTRVYVKGELIKEKPNMVLKMPAGEGTRMILGNSPYGTASWKGEINSLALYPGAFSEEEIDRLGLSLTGLGPLNIPNDTRAFFEYDFKEIHGGIVKDLSENNINIHIPDRVVPLEKNILAWPGADLEIDRRLFLDVALNFIGFAPLGFLLTAVFMQVLSLPLKKTVLLTVVACFCLSLCIEIAQAWLPSRDSSLLDLGMNTIGAGGGAILSDRIYRI